MLDSPVSGGDVGENAAVLMVGGSPDTFEGQAYLEKMGKPTMCGPTAPARW